MLLVQAQRVFFPPAYFFLPTLFYIWKLEKNSLVSCFFFNIFILHLLERETSLKENEIEFLSFFDKP